MPTADQRLQADFDTLARLAAELAQSWTNGNKSDVLDVLEDSRQPELALLVAHLLNLAPVDDPGWHLARALHERGWEA